MNASKSERLVCPECRGDLLRVRRGLLDRLVGLVVASRRYQCARSGCAWSGLLQGRIRRHGTYQSHRPLDTARGAPGDPAERRRSRG